MNLGTGQAHVGTGQITRHVMFSVDGVRLSELHHVRFLWILSWRHKDGRRKWRTEREMASWIRCPDQSLEALWPYLMDVIWALTDFRRWWQTGESFAIYSHGKAVTHLTSRDVNSKEPLLQLWHLSVTPLSTTTATRARKDGEGSVGKEHGRLAGFSCLRLSDNLIRHRHWSDILSGLHSSQHP